MLEYSCIDSTGHYRVCFTVLTWMTRDGPSATISAGIWLSGQFSMLMICRLEHNASCAGRLCRVTLSLMYNDSSFSSKPNNTSTTHRQSYLLLLSSTDNTRTEWQYIMEHNTITAVLRPYVRVYPGEPVPEKTLTHPPSWSSSNLYQLLPSTTIHSILLVQIMCLLQHWSCLPCFDAVGWAAAKASSL